MEQNELLYEMNSCGMESTCSCTEITDTIPAGHAEGEYDNHNPMLAQIYFPSQTYRTGFNPEAALCRGTMFPELVRTYK